LKIFGYEFSLRKAAGVTAAPVWPGSSYPTWLSGSVRESYPGAWQKGVTVDSPTNLLASSVVYACVSGIASDIGKLRIKLTENTDGVWTEIPSGSPWLPVLKKPNHWQTRIEFVEQWITSKLLSGNAYVLKERDARGVVNALYVLNPRLVQPLVAEDGAVYYRVSTDYLSGVEDSKVFEASEIIHDRMICLWHPLVGVSPIYACGMSATMGNKIQANSTNLFGNASRPGGQIMVPGRIDKDQAKALKEQFESNFGGQNVGRIAVMTDGMKFEPLVLTAEASQLIEQLKWTVEDVARAFHYPVWKVGGPLPPYSSGPEALTMMYYTDCLQSLIEKIELCLDEGLGLPSDQGTEVDIDNLMRMDTAALYESNNKAAGWMHIDEMRFRANLPPTVGGDTAYLQQQNYSLAALAKRDAMANPFGSSAAPAPTPPTPAVPEMPTPEPVKRFNLEDIETFEDEVQKELCLQ
jgi:HK97 family phage portal protein